MQRRRKVADLTKQSLKLRRRKIRKGEAERLKIVDTSGVGGFLTVSSYVR